MSELRSGYRQTEVGVIPEDWNAAKIADVGMLQTGPFGTVLKASEYSDDHGVPLISVGEIKLGKIVLRSDTPVVDGEVVRRLPRYLIREGDILFGRKGGVDRSAPVSRRQDGWFLGSDGIRLRPRSEYTSQFLAYQFQTQRIQHWLLENSVGTTMPSMNEAVLNQVSFPVPPTVQEQKAVVEALGDADALIEGLATLIAKKGDIKQGAMQELLKSHRRLPGFTDNWQKVELQSVATFRKGKGLAKGHIKEDGTTKCIHYGELFTKYGPVIGNIISRTHLSEGIVFSKRGDVLMPTSDVTPNGLATASCILEDGVILSGDTLIISPLPDVLVGAFLSNVIRLDHNQIMGLVSGSTVFHLYPSTMAKFSLKIPSACEQRAIAAVLSDMDAEIAALEDRLAKAQAVKLAMMQVLLTGEIRLI